MLELAHHLHPMCVRDLRAVSLGDALTELVGVLAKWGEAADWPRFSRTLDQRVRDASWLLGEGIAMPHARAPGLGELHLAVGRSLAGLGGLPNPAERVHLVFLVAIGQEQGHYLRVASRLAWLVRDAALRQQLVAAPTTEALYLLLREF
jgi:mannitol/fructose-specific phosphotransferase system IIA component (Ntr-type)